MRTDWPFYQSTSLYLHRAVSSLYVETEANLGSLLVSASVDDLKSEAEWDGALGHSRQKLLQELSSKLLIP